MMFQFGSRTWHVDPGWHGTVVVEAEGTNEGLADLQSRCRSAFPARNDSGGQGSRDEERKRVYRVVRERRSVLLGIVARGLSLTGQ